MDALSPSTHIDSIKIDDNNDLDKTNNNDVNSSNNTVTNADTNNEIINTTTNNTNNSITSTNTANDDDTDDESVDIDFSKIEDINELSPFETIMRPRAMLQEYHVNENNSEPIENTITINNGIEALSDFIKCSICKGLLQSIWASPCCHRFCDECITKQITNFKNCPLCKGPLPSKRNCRRDAKYDQLVEILTRSSSLIKESEKELSLSAIQDYRRQHAENTEKFRQLAEERKFQMSLQKAKQHNSSDSMLGKRSHSGEVINHVNFILKPEPNNTSNTYNDDDFLKKPFLRAPSTVSINDLTSFLKTKTQFQRMGFDILIKFNDELLLLTDDTTLHDICIKYYKNADAELVLYFRKKTN